MSPELYRRVSDLFVRALELPPAEQEAFLDFACEGNSELRQSVAQLLANDSRAPEKFLSEAALQMAADLYARSQPSGLSGSDAQSLVGVIVGNYRIGIQIGAGGMGMVHRATDLRLNRPVAIKALPPKYMADPSRVERFRQEARSVSLLNHPNIVSIFDADHDPKTGLDYIATELVDGLTLRQWATDNQPLDSKAIVGVALQIAAALGAAHRAGIVHRDIKPENLMMRPDGIVKVLDFGLAKLLESSEDSPEVNLNLSRAGDIAGTVSYLSPEQILGKPVGPRSDLFSLGIVLYELVTGSRPFHGVTDGAIMDAIVNHEQRKLSSLRPGVAPELERTIEQALEKDPELRFQSAADLKASLLRTERELKSGESKPSPKRAAGRSSRSLREYIAYAAVIAALGVVLLYRSLISSSQTSHTFPYAFQRLTSESDEAMFPALSPDGKQFVYASAKSGNWDIYLQRVGGVTAVNLTKDFAGTDTQPALSPDGTYIAFRSDRDGGGIFVMELTGENPTRVSSKGYFPAWSPDGKQIVYTQYDFRTPNNRSNRNSKLFIVTLATGAERVINGPADAMQPAWSPHGQRIAYWSVQTAGGQRDIFTVDPRRDGPPVALTSDPALDWDPIWSADGRQIYFLSDRGGTMNLWRRAIDERSGRTLGDIEPVTLAALYTQHISLSADGMRLLFAQSQPQNKLEALPIDPERLSTTGSATQVGSSTGSVSDFDLSADESKFVYSDSPDPQEDLWLMNADGTGLRRLTNDTFHDRAATWSPDGSTIAFSTDRGGGNYNIWAIRPDGSGLRQLTNFPRPNQLPNGAWTPDGKLLIAGNVAGPGTIVNAESKTPEKILQPLPGMEGFGWFVFWNPHQLVGRFNRNLWLGTVAENGHREIITYDLRAMKPQRLGVLGESPHWLPGQRKFLFFKDDTIFAYDLDKRKESRIYSLQPNQIVDMLITKNGRKVFFSQISGNSEVWMALMSKPNSK